MCSGTFAEKKIFRVQTEVFQARPNQLVFDDGLHCQCARDSSNPGTPSVSPCAADILFFFTLAGTASERLGARNLMEDPSIQLSNQNETCCPLPTCTVIEASNRAFTSGSMFSCSAAQALSASVRWSHNHLVRSNSS